MDEQVKQEITRLLLEQAEIDEAREHLFIVAGESSKVANLFGTIAKSDYSNLHPAWAIPLYLSRN